MYQASISVLFLQGTFSSMERPLITMFGEENMSSLEWRMVSITIVNTAAKIAVISQMIHAHTYTDKQLLKFIIT